MKYKASLVSFAYALLACSSLTVNAADAPNDDHDPIATERKLEAARHRLDEAAREVAQLSVGLANKRIPDTLMFLGRNPNRAILGLGIGDGSSDIEEQRSEGVSVLAVSPGGPAESAGIKAGDVITEFNGKSLKSEADNSSHEKILRAIGKLAPGDKVTLSYHRDGKTNKATLTTQTLPNHELTRRTFERYEIPFPPGELPGLHGDFNLDTVRLLGMRRRDQFGAIEFAPITPKLGQYFGADKGLLVIHAPSEAQDKAGAKLEEGDVLIDIDGRVPNNPGHAFSILASYQPGEKLTLNVIRQHKKQQLAITVPKESESPRRNRPHATLDDVPPLNTPVPPLPPVAPTT